MSVRELIEIELDRLPQQDLDKLLSLLQTVREEPIEAALPMRAAESSLCKDWLSPEEDVAWSNL